MDKIEPRLVTGVGEGAEYAGAVLVPPGTSTVSADLTRALGRIAGENVGLLVVREPRMEGDAGDPHNVVLTKVPSLEIYRAPADR